MTKQEKKGKTPLIRPVIHFTDTNWINDPCAPGYDPNAGTYHLFYQCNPHSCEWGNMSWGHLTSTDLLHWTQPDAQPALGPDDAYDKDGVFTGCFAPSVGDDTQLHVAYSSVRALPFHWSTPPYPRNAAGISVATSDDGGKTWKKSTQNPVLEGEPDGIAVTGFRDPYLSVWPAAAELLGHAQDTLYGLVSGGIEGSGPTTFIYEVEPSDLGTWKYLGPLVDLETRYQPSKKWSGNYGLNWECTNFMSFLTSSGIQHFLVIGAEGDTERSHIKNHSLPASLAPRTVRAQLWMGGDLIKKHGVLEFRYSHGGYLDHGSYYAANSFIDPKSGRRIVHGWIPEEDITPDRARRKGWNGAVAIPREVCPLFMSNVDKALHSDLFGISSMKMARELNGSLTFNTLGVRPISEMESLRDGCLKVEAISEPLTLPHTHSKESQIVFSAASSTWEMEATIQLDPTCTAVGFHIRQDSERSTYCSVTFSTVDELITVDRSASTSSEDVNTCPESGPFTLFTTLDGQGSAPRQESLRIRIFSDADVLEVFANDRFALATMVYSDRYGEASGVISAFAEGGQNCATFERITLWDGLNGMESLFEMGPASK